MKTILQKSFVFMLIALIIVSSPLQMANASTKSQPSPTTSSLLQMIEGMEWKNVYYEWMEKITIDDGTHTITGSQKQQLNLSKTPNQSESTPPKEEPTSPNEKPEESEQTKGLKDGTYTVPLQILQEKADKPSSMAKYVETPVYGIVKDGKHHLQMTLNESDMIQKIVLHLDDNAPLRTLAVANVASSLQTVEAYDIAKDDQNNKRTVQLQVPAIDQPMTLGVSVDTKSNFGFMEHKVRVIPENVTYAAPAPEKLPTPLTEQPSIDEAVVKAEAALTHLENNQPVTEAEKEKVQQLIDAVQDAVKKEAFQKRLQAVNVQQKEIDQTLGQFPYVVWKKEKDELSVADGYFEKPATVVERNGQKYAQIIIKNEDWWQYFQVEQDGAYQEVTTLKKEERTNEKGETTVVRLVEFPFDAFDREINAKVHIIVKGIPGFEYDNKYDIRIVIQDDRKETVKEDPAEQRAERALSALEKKTTVTEADKQRVQKLIDEVKDPKAKQLFQKRLDLVKVQEAVPSFTNLPFVVLKEDADAKSVADDYFEKSMKTYKKDGKHYVQAIIKNADWWQYFRIQANGTYQDVKVIEPLEGNKQRIEFEVDRIDGFVPAQLHVIVKGIPGFNYDNKYNVRLLLGTDQVPTEKHDPAVQKAKDALAQLEKQKTVTEKDKQSVQALIQKVQDAKTKNELQKRLDQVKVTETEKAKWQSIDYVVWKDDKDETSVADSYFAKPAQYMKKDGKHFIRITVKNEDWWQYFKVQANRTYQEVKTISTNKEEKTRIVEFEIDDPQQIVHAKVHIIVTGIPNFNYDNKYNIRLKFGQLKNEDVTPTPSTPGGPTTTTPSTNDSTTSTTPGQTNERDESLTYDRSEDTPSKEAVLTDVKHATSGPSFNPKTGDHSQLALFALLLLLSSGALMWKGYRRVRIKNL